jgi:hypothetical protein
MGRITPQIRAKPVVVLGPDSGIGDYGREDRFTGDEYELLCRMLNNHATDSEFPLLQVS